MKATTNPKPGRGQASLEYLLLIAGVIMVAVIIIVIYLGLVTDISATSKGSIVIDGGDDDGNETDDDIIEGDATIFASSTPFLEGQAIRDVLVFNPEGSWVSDSAASWYEEAGETVVNSSLVLDGDGDRANLGNTPELDFEGDFTIMAWVRTDMSVGSDYAVIAQKGLGVEGAYGLYKMQKSTAAYFQIMDVGTLEGKTPISDGEWHLVTGVYSESPLEMKLYVDGELDSSTIDLDKERPKVGEQPLLVGTLAPDYFEGNIDELQFYSKALSEAEISGCYGKGLSHERCSPEGLAALWTFDLDESEETGSFAKGEFEGDAKITGRSSRADFPPLAYVVSHGKGIDIIDAEGLVLWMRLPSEQGGIFSKIGKGEGAIYAGSAANGAFVFDLKGDRIVNYTNDGRYGGCKLGQRGWCTAQPQTTQSILSDEVLDVSGEGNLLAIATSRGPVLIDLVSDGYSWEESSAGSILLKDNILYWADNAACELKKLEGPSPASPISPGAVYGTGCPIKDIFVYGGKAYAGNPSGIDVVTSGMELPEKISGIFPSSSVVSVYVGSTGIYAGTGAGLAQAVPQGEGYQVILYDETGPLPKLLSKNVSSLDGEGKSLLVGTDMGANLLGR